MKARLYYIAPRSIVWEVVGLIVTSIAVLHLAINSPNFAAGAESSESILAQVSQFAIAVRGLYDTTDELRAARLEAMRRATPHVDLAIKPARDLTDPAAKDHATPHLRSSLGPDPPISLSFEEAGRKRELGAAVKLRDGAEVTATFRDSPMRRLSISATVLVSCIAALYFAFVIWWAMRKLSTPLRRFAQAAEDFSLDQAPPPLPEKGPDEIRILSKALHRMNLRLRQIMADRIRVLAEIGHDLRTPLTRLRLHAEFAGSEAARTAMIRDLDHMGVMVSDALLLVKGGQAFKQHRLVDLAILLQTICHQFSDAGAEVSYAGPEHLLALGSSDQLDRAVTNLLENALKFGSAAAVRVSVPTTDMIRIDISDNGPGISDHEKRRVLEHSLQAKPPGGIPDKRGIGLGLSIARSIVAAHGGQITLHDAQPTGLIARIDLPLSSDRLARAVRGVRKEL